MTQAITDRATRATKNGRQQAAPPRELHDNAAGYELLGEIVTWTAGGEKPYADVVAALKVSGLPENVAREMLARNAFSRACGKLAKDRLILPVDETDTAIVFQFTRKAFDADVREFSFALECKLTLTKATGEVSCPENPELAAEARRLLLDRQAARTPGDITTIVQRLFEREADLFPIRRQGGAYFVPHRHVGFTEKVGRFLDALGGAVERWPIPKGTPQGDKAAQAAVVDGIEGLVADHLAAVKAFDAKTRDQTWALRLKAISQTRFKIDAYKGYLADKVEELNQAVAEAETHLKAQYDLWKAAKDAPAAAPATAEAGCDHCGTVNEVPADATSHVCFACEKLFTLE